MSAFIADHPRVIDDTNDPIHQLAIEIEEWLDAERKHVASLRDRDDRHDLDGGRIVGLYGGRGTGKTSLMWTLFKRLKEPPNDSKVAKNDLPGLVLPNTEFLRDAVFAPADTRSHDDTLFLLLDHLSMCYDLYQCGAVRAARKIEARRRDVDRFLDYEKDIASSSKDIPKRFVKVRRASATTGTALRNAFAKIASYLRGGPDSERCAVLFVDDLDLQPQRALELLEAIYLFLNLPGVVVFFAADKDLLLHSIETALRARGLHEPGLGGAMLTKLVSHEFSIDALSPEQRVRVLDELPVKLLSAPKELPRWYNTSGWASFLNRHAAEEARRAQARADAGERTGDRRPEPPPPRDEGQWKVELLGAALPPSYRGLIATHNRLLTERTRLEREHADVPFARVVNEQYGRLAVAEPLLRQLVAALLAADMCFPELGLRDELETEPDALLKAFTEILRRDGLTDEETETARRAAPDSLRADSLRLAQAMERIARVQELPFEPPELPVLDRLRSPYLRDRKLGQAARLVTHVARVWRQLNGASSITFTAERILAISHSADATNMAVERWGEYGATNRWHVNVLEHGDQTVEALRAARMDARKQLQAAVLRPVGAVELYIRAKLSLAIWLGWELRYLRRVKAGNLFGSAITFFPGPEEPVRFQDRGRFEILRVDPDPDTALLSSSEDAVVLIDLLGRSLPDQLGAFVGENGEAVRPMLRCRLLPASTRRIEPDDLVPILTDVLELLGRLQQERGVKRFHLGFSGPDVVAFFLGQQLNAWPVSLYEYYAQRQRYDYVFDLEEPRTE